MQYSTIDQLPQVVQDYLSADELAYINSAIFEANQIPQEQRRKVLDVVLEVFFKKTTVEQFPGRLARVMMKTDQEIGPLATEFAMRVFYPARDFLGPVADLAHHWDAVAATKTYDSTGDHFSIAAEPREKYIARVAKTRPAELKTPAQKEAYTNLVTELVDAGDAKFDEPSVVAKLKDLGAESALEDLKRALGEHNHMQRVAKPVQKPKAKKTKSKSEGIEKDVAQAAKTITKKLGASAGAHAPAEQELRSAISEQIGKQVSGVDPVQLDPIILSRVKGVRDARQLTEAIMGLKNANGDAIDGDTAMSIVMIVEEAMASAPKPKHVKPEKKASAKPKKAKTDDVFVNAVGRRSKTKKQPKQLETIGTDHLLQTQEAAHPEEKKPAAPAPKPAPAPVAAAAPTPKPDIPQPETKRLTDVRATQALTGPVQEVEQMRVIDFRRSAQDPETRMEKVLSAIDRIGQENYVDKIQAIFAWRRSEPYQLYEQMLIQALSTGKTMADYISAQNKARKPVLDAAEVEAVIAGNTQLEQW